MWRIDIHAAKFLPIHIKMTTKKPIGEDSYRIGIAHISMVGFFFFLLLLFDFLRVSCSPGNKRLIHMKLKFIKRLRKGKT